MPMRMLPILGFDVNGRFGLNTDRSKAASQAIGGFNECIEDANGSLSGKFCEVLALSVITLLRARS